MRYFYHKVDLLTEIIQLEPLQNSLPNSSYKFYKLSYVFKDLFQFDFMELIDWLVDSEKYGIKLWLWTMKIYKAWGTRNGFGKWHEYGVELGRKWLWKWYWELRISCLWGISIDFE